MDNVEKFIDKLLNQFQISNNALREPSLWRQAYIDELSVFPDTVLKSAAKKIIANRETRTFPLVSECLKVCKELHAEFSKPAPQPSMAPKTCKGCVWTVEMARTADTLFASDWGRQACADGVSIAIWDFMVEHQRWPNQREYDEVKQISLARQADLKEYLSRHDMIHPHTRSIFRVMDGKVQRLKEIAVSERQSCG